MGPNYRYQSRVGAMQLLESHLHSHIIKQRRKVALFLNVATEVYQKPFILYMCKLKEEMHVIYCFYLKYKVHLFRRGSD